MTNEDTPQGKLTWIWRALKPPVILAVILGVTIIGWFLLSDLALHARVHDPAQIAEGRKTDDYIQGKAWATELLGLAGTFAGFLGIAAAARRPSSDASTQRALSEEEGMIGILAGATLLGAGGWPVPMALAAMVTGTAIERVVRVLRVP